MFNILGTSPLLKKYKETDYICRELGDSAMLTIGIVVKQGIRLVTHIDIDYRIEMVNFIAGILQMGFICKLNDCVVALHTAECFLNEYENTFEEYTREFVTCLNISNMNQRLQIRSSGQI